MKYLHRRLGELRHEQALPEGNSPEMFLRYIGSNMTYKSNVSFNNYGYDFDMDYSAVQIGGNLLRLDGEKDSLRGGGAKVTAGATNTNLGYTFTGGKFGQMGELGVGGTVTLKNNLSLYAEVDYRKEINGNGAKGWGYTGGVRWSF